MWIKICGMTDEPAVAAAMEAGADAIGFVFAPSVRELTVERAAQLAQRARGRVQCVAVTLHPTQSHIEAILDGFRPDVLQIDVVDLADLRLPRTLQLLPVVRTGLSPLPAAVPRRILFEGPRSGTGVAVDWTAAAAAARRTELVLAGGLAPENVASAIAAVQPFGVDVSSGVESTPGRKDPVRISLFVKAARAAFAREQLAGAQNEHRHRG